MVEQDSWDQQNKELTTIKIISTLVDNSKKTALTAVIGAPANP